MEIRSRRISLNKLLVREIKEELNSEIEIVSYINEATYDYDFGTVVMRTYHAKLISGKSRVALNTKIQLG